MIGAFEITKKSPILPQQPSEHKRKANIPHDPP